MSLIAKSQISVELVFEFIDLIAPINDVTYHFFKFIEIEGNSKILFSAPFGQGKTTFLNYFFEEKKEAYEVFHLYPVNYSIALNEDIFKYIKVELIFQLLKRDIEFDKEKFSYLQTLPQFILKNKDKLLFPILKALPFIGKSCVEIAESYGKMADEYFKEHEQAQGNDENKALEYIKKFYEEEGSIYEDNFYTQLIRQLLDQIKENGKKTVLIIDDLDRMDPEHIFRVLNVFSAHFDDKEFQLKGYSNKFGFDRVILVCDINNIKNIFCHKYGSSAEFCGYIDKFYSIHPYNFSNFDAVSSIISNSLPPEITNGLKVILKDLLFTNNLSLRELLKIRDLSYDPIIKRLYNTNIDKHNFVFDLAVLLKVFDISSLFRKLEYCKKIVAKDAYDAQIYTSLSGNGLLTLSMPDPYSRAQSGQVYYYDYNGYRLFLPTEDNYGMVKCTSIYSKSGAGEVPMTLKPNEFYDILIKVLEKFASVL